MKLLTTVRQVAQIGYYTHGMMYRNRAEQRANANQQQSQFDREYQAYLLDQRDILARKMLVEMNDKFKDDSKWNKLTLDQKVGKAIKEAEAEMFIHPELYEPQPEPEPTYDNITTSNPSNNGILFILFFGSLLAMFLFWAC